jgi:hypothetical protein
MQITESPTLNFNITYEYTGYAENSMYGLSFIFH